MPLSPADLIVPNWPVPARVGALVTTRRGGVSSDPWATFNLGINTADDPGSVAANQALLQQHLGAELSLQWLRQVHGAEPVEAGCNGGDWPRADACYSDRPGQVCAVLTADCLPVLFCADDGSEVAVAHAGWRGLAAGVLLRTLEQFRTTAQQLHVWLGPAISSAHFEVGADVRQSFARAPGFAELHIDSAFVSVGHDKWRADLYQLARMQLSAVGVQSIHGGNFCTYAERDRFYSYRRDGETGRFASLIWLKD